MPDPNPTTDFSDPSIHTGTSIGRYKVLSLLGEGGFGMVYLAECQHPVKRRAALKVIKPGMDSKQIIARFEAERQALAVMDHPNVAKVLDAGMTENGRSYFVMEYVRGIPITDHCDQQKLSVTGRLRLFIEVCEAVQHAHQKGIMHRDLKPSNILVSTEDDRSTCKVIDFGVAKAMTGPLTERTLYTEQGQIIGTPEYMSPEQAEMANQDIDTRTDIYSLGVVLYELLTGSLPFSADYLRTHGLDHLRQVIREEEPQSPSTRVTSLDAGRVTQITKSRDIELRDLQRELKGDLDWITLKAMDKDRTRRYETANGLAMDIKRFLHNELVVARPPSAMYRLTKAIRRNKLAFGAGAAVSLALVVGITVAVVALWAERKAHERAIDAELIADRNFQEAKIKSEEAQQQRIRAEQQKAIADRNLYAADMKAVQAYIANGNLGAARKLLDDHLPKPGATDHRGWEWRYFAEQAEGSQLTRLTGHTGTVTRVRFSPDGRFLASLGGDFRVWDVERRVSRVWSDTADVVDFDFVYDGRLAAVTSTNEVRMLDPTSLRTLPTAAISPSTGIREIRCANKSPKAALTTTKGQVLWLDLQSGKHQLLPTESTENVDHVDVAADGSRVCGLSSGRVIVWDTNSMAMIMSVPLPAHAEYVNTLFLLPDNRGVLLASFEAEPMRLSLDDGNWHTVFSGLERGVNTFAASDPANLLVASSYSHHVNVWSLDDFQPQRRLFGHLNEVWCVDATADGRMIATGGRDRDVLLWDPGHDTAEQGFRSMFLRCVPVFSKDGGRVALQGSDDTVEVWDLERKERLCSLSAAGTPLRFDNQDRRLLTLTTTAVKAWDTNNWSMDHSVALDFVAVPNDPGVLRGNNFSATADRLAVPDSKQVIHLVDLATGQTLRTFLGKQAGVWTVSLSPDGRWLAAGKQEVELWDLMQDEASGPDRFGLHDREIMRICFSHDSRHLASVSLDTTIDIWDVKSQVLRHRLRGHRRGVLDGGFSADGQTFVSVGHERSLKLWHVDTGRELVDFALPFTAGHVGFSPDGQYLVAAGSQDCRVWKAPMYLGVDEQ